MRNFLSLLVICVMFVTSCTKHTGSDIKIGFLIHSTKSSRWIMDINYIKERADEIGITILLKDASGDENLQLKQATELLETGVDALIVVAANQNTAAGIVREAHNYKVPVIGYDRLIKNADLDYLVSFEYDKVGAEMANYALAKVPIGNYVIVYGDASDANAIFVKNGIEKIINPLTESGKINVVYKSFVEGWSETNAKHMMDGVLDFTDKKIDAVIACNDPMAVGTVNSLREHGYNTSDLVITGQDATLQFVQSMLDGGMTMSVSKPIKELAYGAVDIVVELLETGKAAGFDKSVFNGRKDVPAKLYPPLVVDETNLDQVLIQGGMYTREQVYGASE